MARWDVTVYAKRVDGAEYRLSRQVTAACISTAMDAVEDELGHEPMPDWDRDDIVNVRMTVDVIGDL